MPTTTNEKGKGLFGGQAPEVGRVIDDLTFQANILALEAAVQQAEAIRAASADQSPEIPTLADGSGRHREHRDPEVD